MRGAARALGMALLAAAALAGGCSHPQSGAARSAAPAGTVLLRGLAAEPDSLDPQKARTDEAQRVLRDI